MIHLGLFTFCFAILSYFINGSLSFDESQLVKWDTGWYLSLKENGYVFIENAQNNTGFFPGFPFLWKITGLGAIGISILNLILFVVSFYLLVYYFNPPQRTQYLFLTLPPLFFFFVPYSESLFFLFSTLILIGLKKNNWLLTTLAFMLATFTRSAGTIFIPALIMSMFLISHKSTLKETCKEYSLYIAAGIITTLTVIYIQFLQTGVWFASSKTHIHWKHYFRIPEFPLHSWGENEILFLDGTGMLIGLTALAILLILFIQKIKQPMTEANKSYLFSLLYLGGISLSILLFQGGDIHSLNRYIFATPFYFIFLLEFSKKNFSLKEILLFFLILTGYWLFCGSYKHITIFVNYLLLSVFLILFLFIYGPYKRIAQWSFIAIYVSSVFLQAFLFILFLKGTWIG